MSNHIAPAAKTKRVRFAPLAIAAERCKGCGLCIEICPKHVLALDPVVVNRLGYHPVRLSDAAACTSCARLSTRWRSGWERCGRTTRSSPRVTSTPSASPGGSRSAAGRFRTAQSSSS